MRVKFDKVIRSADGLPNPAAQVSFYLRDRIDVPLPVYTAETGGSAATQPLTPDADGKVSAWLETTLNPIWNFSVLVNHGGGAIQFYGLDLFPQLTDAWTTLTLAGSWTNTSGTAAWLKTAEGFVYVKGLVGGGASGSTIATLPTGARPAQDCSFDGLATSAYSAIGVTSAGVITSGSATAQISLDTICFQTNS